MGTMCLRSTLINFMYLFFSFFACGESEIKAFLSLHNASNCANKPFASFFPVKGCNNGFARNTLQLILHISLSFLATTPSLVIFRPVNGLCVLFFCHSSQWFLRMKGEETEHIASICLNKPFVNFLPVTGCNNGFARNALQLMLHIAFNSLAIGPSLVIFRPVNGLISFAFSHSLQCLRVKSFLSTGI